MALRTSQFLALAIGLVGSGCAAYPQARGDVVCPSGTSELIETTDYGESHMCKDADGVELGPQWATGVDGRLLNLVNVVDGQPHGKQLVWRDSGGLSSEWIFDQGVPLVQRSWHPNGRLSDLWSYSDEQQAEVVRWHENGSKKAEFSVLDGEFEGRFVAWWQNGQLRNDWTWEEGRPHGRSRAWHRNGQLAVEGEYVEGKKAGTWRCWDDLGTPALLTACEQAAANLE